MVSHVGAECPLLPHGVLAEQHATAARRERLPNSDRLSSVDAPQVDGADTWETVTMEAKPVSAWALVVETCIPFLALALSAWLSQVISSDDCLGGCPLSADERRLAIVLSLVAAGSVACGLAFAIRRGGVGAIFLHGAVGVLAVAVVLVGEFF
ncbi:hypothetical protein [Nocardioides silvaticus]|nr:hypothetical protein [Nocardioides silvaticus]